MFLRGQGALKGTNTYFLYVFTDIENIDVVLRYEPSKWALLGFHFLALFGDLRPNLSKNFGKNLS